MDRGRLPIRTGNWSSRSKTGRGCRSIASAYAPPTISSAAKRGVYVAAISGDGTDARAIVIVNALDDREQLSREPIPVRYDGEGREQRLARRRSAWMPVEIQGI